MATPLFSDTNLIIQQHNQGVKLIKRDNGCGLKKQISFNEIINMPFHIYFMNTESELQVFNEPGLKSFNILSESDVIGKNAFQVVEKETAELSIRNDRIAMKTRKLIIKDELYTRLDGYTFPMLSYKFPWFGDDNKILGVFGFSIPLDLQRGISLAHSMNLLTQTGLLPSPEKSLPGLALDEIYFTEREKNIIFQLIRGKTAREIAIILNRSQRTIEKHIENLKLKTHSSSKSELIEKIIDKIF